MRRAALIAVAVAACTGDVQSPSDLDHDRIIAVRATPPRILPGEQASVDVLLAFSQQPVAQRAPDQVSVLSPASLADTVHAEGDRWVVTAPSEEVLAAARTELKLDPGAPVPLKLQVSVRWPYPIVSPDGESFTATKTVWLGDHGVNPDLGDMSMLVNNAMAPAEMELVVPENTPVPLFVQADDAVQLVNWISSCGKVHDYNLHAAHLVVTPDTPQQGQLVVVYRDGSGGVAWRVWQIRAE